MISGFSVDNPPSALRKCSASDCKCFSIAILLGQPLKISRYAFAPPIITPVGHRETRCVSDKAIKRFARKRPQDTFKTFVCPTANLIFKSTKEDQRSVSDTALIRVSAYATQMASFLPKPKDAIFLSILEVGICGNRRHCRARRNSSPFRTGRNVTPS
jgi:hypothetical protein